MRGKRFTTFEIESLSRRSRGLARRFDQVRRDLIDIDVPSDCPATSQRVREIEIDARTIADLERLVAEVRRYGLGSDERPAPVIALVPKPPTPPASGPRPSMWRAALAMARSFRLPTSEVA